VNVSVVAVVVFDDVIVALDVVTDKEVVVLTVLEVVVDVMVVVVVESIHKMDLGELMLPPSSRVVHGWLPAGQCCIRRLT